MDEHIAGLIRRDLMRIERVAGEVGGIAEWSRDLYHELVAQLAKLEIPA
jgi:hypothetical protein